MRATLYFDQEWCDEFASMLRNDGEFDTAKELRRALQNLFEQNPDLYDRKWEEEFPHIYVEIEGEWDDHEL